MAQSELFRELQDVSREPAGEHHTDAGGPDERPGPSVQLQGVVIIPAAVFVLAGVVIAMALVSALNGEYGPSAGAAPALVAAFLAVRGKRLRNLGLCLSALAVLAVWGAVFGLLP